LESAGIANGVLEKAPFSKSPRAKNAAPQAGWLLIENHGNKLTMTKTIGNRWMLIITFFTAFVRV
jgi:hypothetical protein